MQGYNFIRLSNPPRPPLGVATSHHIWHVGSGGDVCNDSSITKPRVWEGGENNSH